MFPPAPARKSVNLRIAAATVGALCATAVSAMAQTAPQQPANPAPAPKQQPTKPQSKPPANPTSAPTVAAQTGQTVLAGPTAPPQHPLPPIRDAQTQVPERTPPGVTPPARVITLNEAINLALANSTALQTAAAAVNRARGVVNESRAGFNPTVGAATTYTHLEPGQTITFPGPNGQPQTINLIQQNQWQVLMNVNLPIDLAGMIRTALQQSEFSEIAARLDFNRTRNDTVLNVKNAYYDVLRAKALVTVQQEALKNAQDNQATAEAQLRAGTGTRFDVLRAATQVANAQNALFAAQNQQNIATATLNNQLGLNQNTPIETAEAAEPEGPSGDFNSEVAEAYRTRPEILQADANIRAAEKGVVLAQRSSMPTVGVGFNATFNPNPGGFSSNTLTWGPSVSVNLPLFDQGLARARTQQAKAGLDTARIAKQTTQDTVALQVRQAYLNLQNALDRLNVTTAALTEAQEQYRLAQVRFRAGVTATPGQSPLLEISDAQAALTQAQQNQVTAQYDVAAARAALDRAIGRYSFTGGGGTPGLPAPPSR